MKYRITLLPGDGIGPEVTDAAVACLQALGLDIEWERKPAGENALKDYGSLLPQETIEAISRNKVALKGPITTPVGKGFRSINVAIRQLFNLYVCLRPIKSFNIPGALYKDVDMVIVRENTEDLYSGVEFAAETPEAAEVIKKINELSEKKIRLDSALSIKPMSAFACERIARFAFEYAIKNNRKKITCIHKANIM
jgi:isocitrate dehydrogenase (NAD+)